jgi:hypothetical protein
MIVGGLVPLLAPVYTFKFVIMGVILVTGLGIIGLGMECWELLNRELLDRDEL